MSHSMKGPSSCSCDCRWDLEVHGHRCPQGGCLGVLIPKPTLPEVLEAIADGFASLDDYHNERLSQSIAVIRKGARLLESEI